MAVEEIKKEETTETEIDVKELVEKLFEEDLNDDEIKKELHRLKEEGKLTEEQVKEGLYFIQNKEKKAAEDLFGVKFQD